MKCEFDLETLKFDDRGLIPAVVTEAGTGKLLMLAYMKMCIRDRYCAAEGQAGRKGVRNF